MNSTIDARNGRTPWLRSSRFHRDWQGCLCAIALLVAAEELLLGQVITYEGNSYPEANGFWQRSVYCTPERSLDGGWLIEVVEIGECSPPPGGDRDTYSAQIESLVGLNDFFMEFRMITDGPQSEFVGQAPATVSAGSLGPVHYGFTIARDQAKFFRDADLPVLFFDIEPDVAHTHRLELHGISDFEYYIDGEVVAADTPEGAYPSNSPLIVWRARAFYVDSTTRFDYLRFGRIPDDSTGDFNSDADIDHVDFYFFHECLSSSGLVPDAGPGCRWADMDEDTDVDMLDFLGFQLNFNGSGG